MLLRVTGRAPLLHESYPASQLVLAPADSSRRSGRLMSSATASGPTRDERSPRFRINRSTRAVPNHPGRPDGCTCSLLPRRCQASPTLESWPPAMCVTRPNRVHVITAHVFCSGGLRRTGHPDRRLLRYMCERAIHMADSFHSARLTRLSLAHQRGHRGFAGCQVDGLVPRTHVGRWRFVRRLEPHHQGHGRGTERRQGRAREEVRATV